MITELKVDNDISLPIESVLMYVQVVKYFREVGVLSVSIHILS